MKNLFFILMFLAKCSAISADVIVTLQGHLGGWPINENIVLSYDSIFSGYDPILDEYYSCEHYPLNIFENIYRVICLSVHDCPPYLDGGRHLNLNIQNTTLGRLRGVDIINHDFFVNERQGYMNTIIQDSGDHLLISAHVVDNLLSNQNE